MSAPPSVVGASPLRANESRLDRDGFVQIYQQEFAALCRFLVRVGIPERDVGDVVHDSFVVMMERWPTYDATRPLRPWLFGIAFRVAMGHRRRRGFKAEWLDTLAEPASDGPGPDMRMEATEARAFLLRVLEHIEEDRRAVFVMHELEEISIPDASIALGIPLNTAYSRLRLAREEVRDVARRLASRGGAR